MKNTRYYILVFVMLAAVFHMSAAPVSIKAKLDSVNLLMGNITTLHLEVVQDKGAKGFFPLFRTPEAVPYVTVCGDSVELRTAMKRDTTDLGSNRIQINCAIPVQAFDSGFYRLPEFLYVVNGDTARSNHVTLKVIPVKVGENEEISGYAGVVEPEGKSIFDHVPDWMIDFWWLIAAILVLLGLLIWGIIRYKKTGSVLPPKPEPSPYEVAMWQLRNLKKRNLWEQGMEKEYFTELTEILRVYLEKRFNINAMEMTTRQIVDTLSDNLEIKDKKDYMKQILDMADFVKFAQVRPLPADNVTAYDNAVRFVEETKPVPVEEDEDKDKEGGKS